MKISTYNNKLKMIRDKAIDKTSDVLSAPARIKAKRVIKRSGKDAEILKKVRQFKNVPNFTKDGKPSDALKYKTAAEEVRMRLKKKNKKQTSIINKWYNKFMNLQDVLKKDVIGEAELAILSKNIHLLSDKDKKRFGFEVKEEEKKSKK